MLCQQPPRGDRAARGRWIVIRAALTFALVFGLAAPAFAQDRSQTLADIRQELTVLFMDIQSIRRELSTTGSPTTLNLPSDMLGRVGAIEAELQRLTAQTEALDLRVNRVVSDGTNRIGDLEFRLVELEGGDVTKLGQTSTLGGQELVTTPLPTTPTNPNTTELAVSEEVDFQKARAALDEGQFQQAAELFGMFAETYPGGPLTTEAHFLRGDAQSELGQWSSAARSYLQSFSSAPDSPIAPDALYRLGVSLDQIGQREEACLTLNEVGLRYPSTPAHQKAQADMARMECGA